jgi:hypothetical protein
LSKAIVPRRLEPLWLLQATHPFDFIGSGALESLATGIARFCVARKTRARTENARGFGVTQNKKESNLEAK